ncbi:MAG: hypothetical protein M1372_00415 [Patescibacteria group bacterium]|nr:hypothetical protein [Patescibacteria group bacterium]
METNRSLTPGPATGPVVGPQGEAGKASVQEKSLREINAGLAARYRELGQRQFDGVLSEGEQRERANLGQMASFGLFDANLSEEQLKAKDAAYKAHIEAETKELIDPQASAERYRFLGRKRLESGLSPEDNEEYMRLHEYAKRGKFELTQAA